MERHIDINQFDYDLPDERIAKFPLAERSASKLLVYRNGAISESRFDRLGEELPEGAMLVFNNTKVIRARIIMHKPSGARIEVFCLEPHAPADYERAFAVKGKCAWSCIVGNLKKWKEGALVIDFTLDGTPQQLRAYRTGTGGREQIVRFEWEADLTFGELLELLGRIPIPPYLNRDSQQIDYTRYQTVYSKFEGSVAAPTAAALTSFSTWAGTPERCETNGPISSETTSRFTILPTCPLAESTVPGVPIPMALTSSKRSPAA